MAYLKGKGCILAANFSGGSYTTIANRTEISGPSRVVETVDTTNLDSSAREHIPTIADNGEVTCKIFFDPDNSTHIALEALVTTPASINWRITFTDGTPSTYTFSGTLTQFGVTGMTVDGVVSADLTIKITGAITKA